jgi:hypothetical protein
MCVMCVYVCTYIHVLWVCVRMYECLNTRGQQFSGVHVFTCMYMCVVCVYACGFLRLTAFWHASVCMHACVYMCMYGVCMSVCTHVTCECIHVYTCMRLFYYFFEAVQTSGYVRMYVCVYIYIYIHIHMHTYVCIYV